MRRVLISGYYGYNNIGDEAVLGGLLAGLRAELPEVEPVVLSGNPDFTRELHGVAAISRMSISAIRAALHSADLLISGGGSLLQDVTSFQSPLYYLGILWLAQRMGVPTVALAQGMGPLNHPFNRWLARRVLDRTHAITVRDAESAEFLRRLEVSVPPEVTADPSFLLEPDESERLREWWGRHIPANRPVIAAALRPWQVGDHVARYTAIADALAALVGETGALLLFIPMQHGQDLRLSEEMAGWTPAESRVLDLPLTPREMVAAVGACDLLLAMRLHALIFAVQQGTPAVGIAYDPKVRDFAEAADLPTPPAWENLASAELTALLQQQWKDRDAVQEVLAAGNAHLTALARRNIERVRAILS